VRPGQHRNSPPRWWPANEPWPPRKHPPTWRGRPAFVRRVAFAFAVVLLLSATGVIALTWLAAGRIGGGATAVIAVLLLMLVARLFVTGMSRVGVPLGDVVAAADRVAGGDYTTRVIERGPPFLRRMARAFNSMTERLQVHDQQRRNLMADIAHELRTPLAVVQGRLEGLLDGVYPRDDEQLGELLEESRTLARLVDDLGVLAQSERGAVGLQKEATDLAALMHDAARSLAEIADQRGVAVRVDDSKDLAGINIDPLRMREVLTNLLSNAIYHSNAGAAVRLGAELRPDEVVIRVQDNGSGIAPEDLPRIFDRFHKGARSHGSGLGLAIARNFVHAHGGTIGVDSAPGRGTTMTVTIPLGGPAG